MFIDYATQARRPPTSPLSVFCLLLAELYFWIFANTSIWPHYFSCHAFWSCCFSILDLLMPLPLCIVSGVSSKWVVCVTLACMVGSFGLVYLRALRIFPLICFAATESLWLVFLLCSWLIILIPPSLLILFLYSIHFRLSVLVLFLTRLLLCFRPVSWLSLLLFGRCWLLTSSLF